MDNTARVTAETLIDLYSAYADEDNPPSSSVFHNALVRLSEAGAVKATRSPGGEQGLDISPLLNAYAVQMIWLVDRLSEATGTDRDAVLFDLREFVARAAK